MSSKTPNLDLLKKNPVTDGNDTFDIDTMLNDNWDKIDESVATKDYVNKKSTRILVSSTPPENPEIGTIWYDDKGEDYDIGDGLVVGNASFDASTDIWFEEI